MGWDGMEREGMGWDGMEWEGMGENGMQWNHGTEQNSCNKIFSNHNRDTCSR